MAVKKFTIEQDRMEVRAVKAELAALGWTHRDVAAKTGLKKGTVSNVLSGHYPCWPARAAINAAIGRDIFTKPDSNATEGASSADKQQTKERKQTE